MKQPTAATLLKPAATWGPTAPKLAPKDELLQQWLDAKTMLSAAKDKEMELRKQVVAAFPFTEGAKEGTHRVPLANGWQLKVVLKQNYTLNKLSTDAALLAWENSTADPAEKARIELIAERLVSWSPELSVKEWRLLTDDQKKFLEPALTIKDGSPTLELEEPKTK